MSSRPQRRSWMSAVLLGAAVMIVSALVVGSQTRSYEALLALADMNAGAGPSRFKATTATPTRSPVGYTVWGRPWGGDLYLPGQGRPEAAIVLVPGVVRKGKDDPRLVAFATTLARARFAVLVPDLPGFQTLRVQSDDATEVAAAFEFLVSRADLAPKGRGGMAAFSYAVGISVLAAMDERIRDRVRFILGVGGYYDMIQVITFFTTGYFRKDSAWEHFDPDPYPALVFVENSKDALEDPNDRTLIQSMVDLKLSDSAADISSLAARLGPEGRALYDLWRNTDPRRTATLIERLPEAVRDNALRLSLSNKDLTRIKARLILLANPADTLIPYTQSLELARAVPKGQAQVRLVGSLEHVELKHWHYLSWAFLTNSLTDFWHMYGVVYGLLGERERAS